MSDPPDLLVSGPDRPARQVRPWHRRAALVVLVVAVLVAVGLLVFQDRARDERQRVAAAEQDVVLLSLLDPGQDLAPRHGPRRPGIHLVVANAGPAPVRLLRGTVAPGAWQVEVPTDRELRPGRSRRLELRPPRACGTPQPRRLQLEARSRSGRTAAVELDLTAAQLAYGGTLADAVAATSLDCDPTAVPGSGGRAAPHRSEVVRPSR